MNSSGLGWIVILLIGICSSFVTVVHGADFYKLLGISRDATQKEIKKAYRSKSLQYHPDKNPSEDAADKFAEIARAYEVLSDEELKQAYDQGGEEGLKRHEQRGGGGGGGFDPFEDLFSHFGGGRRQRNDQESRTASVVIPLHLSLRQMYLGQTLEVEYHRQVLCMQWEMCMKNAPDCAGPGVRMVRQQLAPGFVQQMQQRDDRCIARGKMWQKNCRHCPKKTSTEKIDLTVEITPGLRHDERITFEGVTDEKPGHLPGDLHFVLVEEEHPEYKRKRDDLYKRMEVPLVDALVGFSIELTHVDDHKFTVQVDGVIDCDHVLRVPGKGMPRRNGRGFGDLFLTFEVDFPDKLSDKQKTEINKILRAEGTSDEL